MLLKREVKAEFVPCIQGFDIIISLCQIEIRCGRRKKTCIYLFFSRISLIYSLF